MIATANDKTNKNRKEMHLFIIEKQINEKATTITYFMYICISICINVNKNLNLKKLVNMSFNKLIQLLI